MLINVESGWLLTALLVSIRFGVLMFATPMDAVGRIPVKIKVFFALIFSVLLVSVLDTKLLAVPEDSWHFGLMAVKELMVGMMLVFGIYTALGAFMLAGRLIDFQTGFAAASVLNPATNTQNPMIGTALQIMAILLFFILGLHHYLIKGFAYSLEVIPVGEITAQLQLKPIVKQFGMMFTYGVMLAGPVIAGLALVDLATAVISRTMPQMNIYFVMLPLKIFFGLMLTAVSLKYMLPLAEQVLKSIFDYWMVII